MKTIKTVLAILILSLFPPRVLAAPPTLQDASNMAEKVFSIFIPLGALLATAMIVWGGYMWMMSNGDPGKIKQAQGTLTWAIIGLVFLGIFRMILELVFGFLSA